MELVLGKSISAESISELVGACRGLVKLGLENCQVNDDAMTAVSRNRDLKTLHLGMVQGLTPRGLEIMGRGPKSIEELNLGWINLKTDMLEPLRNGVLTSNAETLSRLVYQDITFVLKAVGRICVFTMHAPHLLLYYWVPIKSTSIKNSSSFVLKRLGLNRIESATA